MAQDASAAAAPVEQRSELSIGTLLARATRIEIGVVPAAVEEEPGVGVQRADLRAHSRRRQRQAVVCVLRLAEERRSRGEGVLVRAHGRAREMQPVERGRGRRVAGPSVLVRSPGDRTADLESSATSALAAHGRRARLQRRRRRSSTTST